MNSMESQNNWIMKTKSERYTALFFAISFALLFKLSVSQSQSTYGETMSYTFGLTALLFIYAIIGAVFGFLLINYFHWVKKFPIRTKWALRGAGVGIFSGIALLVIALLAMGGPILGGILLLPTMLIGIFTMFPHIGIAALVGYLIGFAIEKRGKA